MKAVRTYFLVALGYLLCVSVGIGAVFQVVVYNAKTPITFGSTPQNATTSNRDTKSQVPPWNAERLHTRLKLAAKLFADHLEHSGIPPEVICIQGIARCPVTRDIAGDYASFQEQHIGVSLSDLLVKAEASGKLLELPVEALLLKAMAEAGAPDYHVAAASTPSADATKAPLVNVVFSLFPIAETITHPVFGSSDILEVHLTLPEGGNLIIFNNNWSGHPSADSAYTQSAQVLRTRLEQIGNEAPDAGILLVGNFGSNYAQHQLSGTYNLWNDLPADQRGSTVSNGYWITPMQMLISSGLADGKGVEYIKGSFRSHPIDGVNVERRWRTPIGWHFYGKGHGYSEHLPISALFSYGEANGSSRRPPQADLVATLSESGRLQVDYTRFRKTQVHSIRELGNFDANTLAQNFGNLYFINTRLEECEKPSIKIGKRVFGLHSEEPEVVEWLKSLKPKQRIRVYGMLCEHDCQLQFVVYNKEWIIK